jgi:hypothetical protein
MYLTTVYCTVCTYLEVMMPRVLLRVGHFDFIPKYPANVKKHNPFPLITLNYMYSVHIRFLLKTALLLCKKNHKKNFTNISDLG